MMKVTMDEVSYPSRERVKPRFNKNVEMENRGRQSAKIRIPSDPNTWQQIREKYEAMILEDHDFSQQHEIEYTLWQLHYKRIEELRGHFSAATSQFGKDSTRPDQITKIRSQLNTFISEATEFYHDIMLKIRAKYGLPLDDPENQILLAEKENSDEMKNGLLSCHRCLIYLGDLARYKGLYGDGDSKETDFAAASKYYRQAFSLWPSSGNPHHQLAILATYAGDELASIYQYFRSLAVDNPFSTARDNLIMVFEKNRQSYSQLVADVKTASDKTAAIKMRRGRGKGDRRVSTKDYKSDAKSVKEKVCSLPETLNAFNIRFIRLNGILFTRTSLETFEEVFATVRRDFLKLLSFGSEKEVNIGSSAAESRIMIVRIISILIFTVHNAYRKTENQSYTEIMQRSVLLQNAFTATFEFMGAILERCLQLHDPSTSYLCPGALVFLEWLACQPNVAASSQVEDKQAEAVSFFWIKCVSFLNSTLSSGGLSTNEDADETFLSNKDRYDEGETDNRIALSEDLELRGFLPLAPAHLILDFSRKQSLASDAGIKEKEFRVQRIIAAGKALANTVRIGQQSLYFDSKLKKFVIGVEPQVSNDDLLTSSMEVSEDEHPRQQFYVEDEEEDEEIVFKPVASYKNANAAVPDMTRHEVLSPVTTNTCSGEMKIYSESVPTPNTGNVLESAFDTSIRLPSTLASLFPQQHLHPTQLSSSKWLLDQHASISNGLNKMSFEGTTGQPVSHSQTVNPSHGSSGFPVRVPEIPSTFDSIIPPGAGFDRVSVNNSYAVPAISKKNPVSRPVRHVGPPPGFHHVPPKTVDQSQLAGHMRNDNLQMDDYRWLDGYQLTSSTQGTNSYNPINYSSQMLNHTTWNNNFTGHIPGNQYQGQTLRDGPYRV